MTNVEGYTEDRVVSYLRERGVGFEGNRVFFNSGQLGIKALGMVDYLVNKHRYALVIRALKR